MNNESHISVSTGNGDVGPGGTQAASRPPATEGSSVVTSASGPVLRSYQLAVLLSASTICALFWFPFLMFRWVVHITYPAVFLQALASQVVEHPLVSLLILFAYLFGAWWLIIWFWRRSSGHFKLAFLGCVLVAFALYWGLESYRDRVDWASRGLNPARPGFEPVVLLLAGTFEQYTNSPLSSRLVQNSQGRFEIRMRGADYYYAKSWRGHSDVWGSWEEITLGIPGNLKKWHRHSRGTRGWGGGSSYADPQIPLIARRMWSNSVLIGASSADEVSTPVSRETFSELRSFGPFNIPQRIEFATGNAKKVLHVRRVEFLNEPGTNWFHLVYAKYFGHKFKAVPAKLLNEPGWTRKGD